MKEESSEHPFFNGFMVGINEAICAYFAKTNGFLQGY